MPREDVVHVLRHYCEALGGDRTMLDLQVIPPNPIVEAGGERICEIDGSALLADAAAAASVVDAFIAGGALVEDAVDDHEVRSHYASGPELVEDFVDRKRKVPPAAVPLLEAIDEPCVIREACRLRRLRVV
jgi:hypothetical protein